LGKTIQQDLGKDNTAGHWERQYSKTLGIQTP